MAYQNDTYFAGDEIRSNQMKTIFLLIIMLGIIWGLAWMLGMLIGNVTFGLKIGFLVCIIIIPLEMMAASFCIMTLTDCLPLNLNNEKEKQVLDLVQGLSIAAGLSRVPDVYLIKSNIPNALTAGWNEDSAFIAVTSELIEQMDRQELEAIIGHEIAHIVHRDIQVTQMALALNSGILILAIAIKYVALLLGVTSRNIYIKIAFFILFLLIYPLSQLTSLLLFFSISRSREYSADALSVRLCSYSNGLVNALKKLEKTTQKYTDDQIDALGGKELESLYFYFGDATAFSTHPSIKDRIHKCSNMY